jgi:hypothetical protein
VTEWQVKLLQPPEVMPFCVDEPGAHAVLGPMVKVMS